MGLKSLVKRGLLAAGYEVYRAGPPSTWVPPGHFYSPIVDLNELRRDETRVFDRTRGCIPGISLNEHAQLRLVDKFRNLYRDLPFGVSGSDSLLYYYYNDYYRYGDEITLACMLRHFRPKRLIEFGSGFSSCAILDVNRLFLDETLECTFVDPHLERLQTLLGRQEWSVRIVKSRAQDIDLDVVSVLRKNDIVFIDSTHVSKAGSDVNFHLFELLPRLAPGVLIHFHDIFYPFEYPEQWFFGQNRSWNEIYTLRALLTDNPHYEIVLFNDFLGRKHLDTVAAGLPLFREDPGGAFWLRKLS